MFLDEDQENEDFELSRISASNLQVYSDLNFVNATLICYCSYRMFQLCHIFVEIVSNSYVVVFLYYILMRHGHKDYFF